MAQCALGKGDFPCAVADCGQGIFFALFPIGECPNEVDFDGVRCPFAEHPSFGGAVQPVVFVPVGEILKRHCTIVGQLGFFSHNILVATLDDVGVWLEPRVVADK